MLNMYSVGLSRISGAQPLTAATKAKLSALGVDTKDIKTESEGKMRLQEAQMSRNSESTDKVSKSNSDSILEEAKTLAKKLNISVGKHENINDILDKITNKISEMKADAGNDFDKLANVGSYDKELSMLESSHLSQIDLSATMNLTANMNMVYHGLYQ